MANILDYLDWRGDLTLAERGFNEVDNLLMAELCFLDFSGIVPADFSAPVSLPEAMQKYDAARPQETMGVLVPEQIPELGHKMAASRRFSDLTLCAYVSRTDEETQTQFSALTALLPDKTAYIAFRGTDDTIVGWKEDFNLAFLPVVPAQRMAAEYLAAAAAALPSHPLRVGGHSKGGNLAVYSAVFCGEAVQNQLMRVYNNDGPGFRTSLLGLPEHRRVADKITTILPESSVVGMLLEHEERYEVVRSTQSGLWQHDGFSWQVRGEKFEHLPDLTEGGKLVDETIRTFILSLSPEQRVAFTDALFDILTCTDAGTLTDLKEGGLKTAAAMHLCLNAAFLDIKGDLALDTVQVVVQTGGCFQKQRSRHAVQVQCGAQGVGKQTFDRTNGALRVVQVQRGRIVCRDDGFAHNKKPLFCWILALISQYRARLLNRKILVSLWHIFLRK